MYLSITLQAHFDRVVIDVVGLRVLRIDLADALQPLLVVVPVGQRAAVRERREEARIALEQLDPLPGAELVEDLAGSQREHIGAGRELETRDRLLRDRGAADLVIALEDADIETRAGQITGGDESVMARADDNRVVLRGLVDNRRHELVLRVAVRRCAG